MRANDSGEITGTRKQSLNSDLIDGQPVPNSTFQENICMDKGQLGERGVLIKPEENRPTAFTSSAV